MTQENQFVNEWQEELERAYDAVRGYTAGEYGLDPHVLLEKNDGELSSEYEDIFESPEKFEKAGYFANLREKAFVETFEKVLGQENITIGRIKLDNFIGDSIGDASIDYKLSSSEKGVRRYFEVNTGNMKADLPGTYSTLETIEKCIDGVEYLNIETLYVEAKEDKGDIIEAS